MNSRHLLRSTKTLVGEWMIDHNRTLFVLAVASGAALVAWTFAALLWGALGARAMQDDVTFFLSSKNSGTWEQITQNYATWTGRWAWIALMDATMRATGGDLRFVIVALLLAGAAVWAWAFGWRAVGIFAAVLVTAVTLTPKPGQSVYWLSAAANILPALLFAPMLLIARRKGQRAWLMAPVGWMLALLLCSFHEGSALVIAALLAALLVRGWVATRSVSIYDAAAFVGAIIGLAVMARAPGNAVRMATASGHLPASRSVELGLSEAHSMLVDALPVFQLYFPSWLDLPHFSVGWSGAFAFWTFLAAALWGAHWRPAAQFKAGPLLASAAGGAALCTLVFVASALGIKQVFVSYERVFFVPAFVVALTAAVAGYTARAMLASAHARVALALLALLAVPSSLERAGEVTRLAREMRAFARQYDAQRQVFATLQNQDVVAVPPTTPFGGLFWSNTKTGLMSEPSAKFYGLRSLRAPQNRN